jgi:hypothetical protein
MDGKGAISGLPWQKRMPVPQGYRHPYTNVTSTPDQGPDLERERKGKNRRYLLPARRGDKKKRTEI